MSLKGLAEARRSRGADPALVSNSGKSFGACANQVVGQLDKLLDKLDKFRVLQHTAQLQCKPIKKRGIT